MAKRARNGRARVTSEDERVSLYYRSPQDIHGESFTHRMRGLDENEVREYLDLLADQIEAVEWERTEMVHELERLRAGDRHLNEHPHVTPSPMPEVPPKRKTLPSAKVTAVHIVSRSAGVISLPARTASPKRARSPAVVLRPAAI